MRILGIVVMLILGLLVLLLGLCFLGFGLQFIFNQSAPYLRGNGLVGLIELGIGGMLVWGAVAIFRSIGK